MTKLSETAALASIGAATKDLRLSSLKQECERIANDAIKERISYLAFLAECLSVEVDDRSSTALQANCGSKVSENETLGRF